MEKNLGHATAYGYAKSKGYSGTEDEFAELMADYASVGQSAAQSASEAATSATSASGSAATATQAAQTATDKASEAVTAADTATTKASEANQSASTASAAALSASTSAQTATTAATTATAKAREASESATTATTAKTDAETARDAAAQSASQAAESARTLTIDTTLKQSGQAADAKATGDAITELKNDLTTITYNVNPNEKGEFVWELKRGYWSLKSESLVWSQNANYLASAQPIAVKSGDIIHIKQGLSIVFFSHFSSDKSTWSVLTNTVNHDITVSSDGYVMVSVVKKPQSAFTDKDVELFFEKYLTIYRKVQTNIVKQIENINNATGIIVNEAEYVQSYVTASASTTEGDVTIPIEISASKGETFIIKADFSVTHPEFFSDIKLSIRERYNNTTISDERYTNLSEPIEYTVKQTSTTSIIFIVVWVKESDSSVTTSYYENFDYRICVAKKNDELSDVMTESGDIWEV